MRLPKPLAPALRFGHLQRGFRDMSRAVWEISGGLAVRAYDEAGERRIAAVAQANLKQPAADLFDPMQRP